MRRGLLLDTGPLVAFLNATDAYHEWAVKAWREAAPPLRTCEAVLAEACHLLSHVPGGAGRVLELLRRGSIHAEFQIQAEAGAIARLLAKYSDVPMDLADACLLRMAELDSRSVVMTLDGDFRVYRKHGRRAVPLVMPNDG